MEIAWVAFTVISVITYLIGVIFSRREDDLSGIYVMPGFFMMVVSILSAMVLFYHWLIAVGLALPFLYLLYWSIRLDSYKNNDKKVIIVFAIIFLSCCLVALL